MKRLGMLLSFLPLILLWIGGIAWGIYGVTGVMGDPVNIVQTITLGSELLENLVYILVGISALLLIPIVGVFGKIVEG